jgi:soluble lytic murein transglycosylase-like protein
MRRNAISRARLAGTLATGLFILAVPPAPSARRTPAVFPDFAPVDVTALGDWLARPQGERDGRLFTPADLDAALAADPRHFALFSTDAAALAESRYLERLPFGASIREAAERHRLDALLVASVVWAESRFAPRAVSPRGAVGLMQVMPATAALYGVGNLRDPRENVDVGSRYLASLLDLYGGDLTLALAAYNAGPAMVERYGGVPPFRETRRYVARVLARYAETRRRVEAAAIRSEDPFLPARVTVGGATLPGAVRSAG